MELPIGMGCHLQFEADDFLERIAQVLTEDVVGWKTEARCNVVECVVDDRPFDPLETVALLVDQDHRLSVVGPNQLNALELSKRMLETWETLFCPRKLKRAKCLYTKDYGLNFPASRDKEFGWAGVRGI
jgi:hypothetical protein